MIRLRASETHPDIFARLRNLNVMLVEVDGGWELTNAYLYDLQNAESGLEAAQIVSEWGMDAEPHPELWFGAVRGYDGRVAFNVKLYGLDTKHENFCNLITELYFDSPPPSYHIDAYYDMLSMLIAEVYYEWVERLDDTYNHLDFSKDMRHEGSNGGWVTMPFPTTLYELEELQNLNENMSEIVKSVEQDLAYKMCRWWIENTITELMFQNEIPEEQDIIWTITEDIMAKHYNGE